MKLDADNDTVWLTQAQMVELFGSSKANISEHITNILQQGELMQEATVRNFRTVRKEGNRTVTRNIDYYNLDMIISIGFRVNSRQGIQFRQWATQVLKRHLLQGYSVNHQLVALQERVDERLIRIEQRQDQQQQQLDFFIRTSTPPAEMVFFEGDFYTARAALENLVRTATTSFDRHGTCPEQSRRRIDSKYDNYGIHIYTPTVQQSILRWNHGQLAA